MSRPIDTEPPPEPELDDSLNEDPRILPTMVFRPRDTFERHLAPPPLGDRERIAQLERVISEQEQRLDGMLRIAANLGRSREPKKAMRTMVEEISRLLDADRTTIYELRGDRMLYGLAVQGEAAVEVGVPIGEGIAGLVALRGKAINLKDAYLHPAFSPKFDKLTGYRTRSMLCVPMRNPKRDVIGVVQVLNKRTGYFTVEDERLLTALTAQAAITMEALKLQLRLNISNTELRGLSNELAQKLSEIEFLYDNEQRVAEATSVEELASGVLELAARIGRCEVVALYLPGEDGEGPTYLRGGDVLSTLTTLCHVRRGDGVLGATVTRGECLILTSPEDFQAAGISPDLGEPCGLSIVDAVSAPLVDDGRIIGAVALLNRREVEYRDDVTDNRLVVLLAGQLARAVTRMVARQSAQLRDRLMTIGQMLSGVLHDLKGPMAIISGYAQLMAETDRREERVRMGATIRRQVAQFNDMTREVMAFARGERSIISRKVFLDKFVQDAEEALRSEFQEKGVAFVVEGQVNGTAYFDEPKMHRVVANIARNARQALGEHGTFKWTLKRDEPDGALVFEFEDDGPGIPEAIRDRMFEAFTTSGKADGTGLGLAIVRRIVEDHGGQVSFTTATGQGTRFVVRIPQNQAAA